MNKLCILLGLCAVLFNGCKKVKEDDVEPYKGKNYFPVNTGHQVVYDVEHITLTTFSGVWDTVNYQVKEITTSTYTDLEGRSTQRIERYIDNDTTTGFVLDRVWAANMLTSTAHRVEENIRYVKLVFPQTINQLWNGNSLNTLGVRNYTYTALHVPLQLGALTFDSTCTVVQLKDSVPLSYSKNIKEQYATNIGMIYKINSQIFYDGSGNIDSANIYREKIVSYVN